MPLSDQMKAAGWVEHDRGQCPISKETYVEFLMLNVIGTQTTKAGKISVWPKVLFYREVNPDEF